MAPVANKRRRNDEEDRRPKKKKGHFKKQKWYHSSSEDESDDGASANGVRLAVRASDAPAKGERPAKVGPQPRQVRPSKPILKAAAPPPQPRTAVDEWKDDTERDEFELAKNTALNQAPMAESESEDDMDDEYAANEAEGSGSAEEDTDGSEDRAESETSSTTSSNAVRTKKKRHDPSAFANSMTKILETKLSTAKRTDPVLSRSKSAAEANRSISGDKLEAKARAQVRSERKADLEKGRVRDVLRVENEGVDTGRVMEEEKRLKKTAQRGVVKLFNAVRAAQVKGEEAMKQAKSEGVVGMRQRAEGAREMSKQGFLDLISGGGKAAVESEA